MLFFGQLMEELSWDYASIIYSEEPGMIAAKDELLRQSTLGRAACMGQVTDSKNTLDCLLGFKVCMISQNDTFWC